MRKLFELFGVVAMDGAQAVATQLKGVDKLAKTANRNLGKFARGTGQAGKAMTSMVTGPVAALTAGMTALAVETGNYADRLLDLGQITGLSTDTLQEMQNVARVAGVSFDAFTDTVQKFSSRLPLIRKGTGPAAEAMKQLGVNVFEADGSVRDINKLFPEMIKKLQGMENVTERNAIAQQLLGRNLTDLAPVLGMTSEAFDEARAEAHELGLVLSDDALESANELRIDMEKMRAVMRHTGRQLATSFVPLFRDTLVPMFRETVVPALQNMAGKIKTIGDRFNALQPKTKQNIVKFVAMVAAIGPLLIVISKLALGIKGLISTIVVLKGAIVGLNIALASNPFAAAAIAIGVFGVAVWRTYDAMVNLNKEREKFTVSTVESAKVKELTANFEELQQKIVSLGGQYEKTGSFGNLLGEDIEALAEKTRALGFVVEGDAIEKYQRLEQVVHSLNQVLKPGLDGYVTTTKEQKEPNGADAGKKKLTEEEIKELEKLQAARDRLFERYKTRQIQLEGDELASLERRRKLELSQANLTAREKKIIDETFDLEREQIVQDHLANEQRIAQKNSQDRQRIAEEWNQKYWKLSRSRIEIIEDEMIKELAATQGNEAAQKKVRDYYKELHRQESRRMVEEDKQRAAETVLAWTSAVQTAANSIGAVSSSLSMNRQIDTENWYERERQAIENSVSDEEERARRIEALDAKMEKKRKDEARRQAILDKASALFSVAINTLVEVTKSLSNPVLAGIVAAAGAANAAVIAARPIPFAKGGMVKAGDGVNALIGEGVQDEVVFPLKTGISTMVEMLMDKIGGIRVGMPDTGLAMAGAGASSSGGALTINVGTMIADDYGIKEFERRALRIRNAEAQRKGA